MVCIAAVITMVFTATACDNGGGENAPSRDSSSGGSPTDSGGAVYNELNLKTAIGEAETSFSGTNVQWFIDYLNEKSGGKIVLECYYNGSFCTNTEVKDYLTSGDLDLSFTQDVFLLDVYPMIYTGVATEPFLLMDTLNAQLTDPKLGPMLREKAAEYNWYPYGFGMAGVNMICSSKKEVTGWDQIIADGISIGTSINMDIYQAMGASTIAVQTGDMYESLSRGVCDSVAFNTSGIMKNRLYEVSSHILNTRAYLGAAILMMNLDLWNSLNADTQQLFMDAALAFSEHTTNDDSTTQAELKKIMLDKGGTWNELSDEDAEAFCLETVNQNIPLLKSYAESLGWLDDLEVWVDFRREHLGLDYTF